MVLFHGSPPPVGRAFSLTNFPFVRCLLYAVSVDNIHHGRRNLASNGGNNPENGRIETGT